MLKNDEQIALSDSEEKLALLILNFGLPVPS
jgi:hypothetical protein